MGWRAYAGHLLHLDGWRCPLALSDWSALIPLGIWSYCVWLVAIHSPAAPQWAGFSGWLGIAYSSLFCIAPLVANWLVHRLLDAQ